MIKRSLIAMGLSLVIHAPLLAEELSYSYVSMGAGYGNFVNNQDASFVRFEGSYEFEGSPIHVFATGSGSIVEEEEPLDDIDIEKQVTGSTLGLGRRIAVSEKHKVHVRVAYAAFENRIVKSNLNRPTTDADVLKAEGKSGYYSEVGMRSVLSGEWHSKIAITYSDIGRGVSSSFSLIAAIERWVSDSGTVRFTAISDDNGNMSIALQGRFYYDK